MVTALFPFPWVEFFLEVEDSFYFICVVVALRNRTLRWKGHEACECVGQK
jgi:hypothetical protein